MKIRSAVMTLLNTTALADGKASNQEKAMIFSVMKKHHAMLTKNWKKVFWKT